MCEMLLSEYLISSCLLYLDKILWSLLPAYYFQERSDKK